MTIDFNNDDDNDGDDGNRYDIEDDSVGQLW